MPGADSGPFKNSRNSLLKNRNVQNTIVLGGALLVLLSLMFAASLIEASGPLGIQAGLISVAMTTPYC